MIERFFDGLPPPLAGQAPGKFRLPAFVPTTWAPDGSGEVGFAEVRTCTGSELLTACRRTPRDDNPDLHSLLIRFRRAGGGADDLVGDVLCLPPKKRVPGEPLQIAARTEYVRRRERAIQRHELRW